jgi:hypothetical protein
MVAAESRISLPSPNTLGFLANHPGTATLGLLNRFLADAAAVQIETGVATADAECFPLIADRRLEFRAAFVVTAIMPVFSLNEIGH